MAPMMQLPILMRALGRRSALSLLLHDSQRHALVRCQSTAAPALQQSVALTRLAHQSKLQLQLSDRARTNIEIIPVLSSAEFACNVLGHGDSTGDILSVVQEQKDGESAVTAVRITKNADTALMSEDDAATTLQLYLPHLIDLQLSLVKGDVRILDKIEGDVKITVGDGDIRVSKLRGEEIHMKTNKGSVHIASLLEGEKVTIAANAVDCKRLMSGTTEIKLGKGSGDPQASEFGAIYSSACVINSLAKGGIQVGNVHGYLRVVGDELPHIHVHSVNGAIDLEDSGAQNCDVVAHFDSWTEDASSSILVGGNVVVSVEPTAPIEVELHGREISTDGCAFSESELDQLDVDYAIFSGVLEPKSDGKAASVGAASSGKINVGSAKNAAMRTSFFMNGDDITGSDSDSTTTAASPRLLVHATSGTVKLEQLDWMAKLKRKHLKQ
uniref:DUF4097 domain-containing protein n=1 Tax=Globisporangium ultimum (strain ATCC 200006 / CBS 805.95 / DAOM BR144) TaxID=431595 RepID=K3WT69_GLOUD